MPIYYALLYNADGHHYRTIESTERSEVYRAARKGLSKGERCCIATNAKGDHGTMYEKSCGLLTEAA